jgi:methionine synthase I (cobalamin-dependent)
LSVSQSAPRADALARFLDPSEIVLVDGAMGTMLYTKGVFINQCYDELALRSPELVRDVHRAYVAAGAEVLETNTFGANRAKLVHYGLEGQVAAINRRGAELAREAADATPGAAVLVAGAVGPLGVRIEPYGPTGRDEARALFREQIQALRDGGADLVILETFADLLEVEQAIRAARDVDPAMPVVAQMTVGVDLRTPYGATPADVARALDAWGADVIGLNCSVGRRRSSRRSNRWRPSRRASSRRCPTPACRARSGGRHIYMASAEYFATYARHLVQGGAKIVGGCCGTTPEHIRAMAQSLRVERAMATQGRRSAAPVAASVTAEDRAPARPGHGTSAAGRSVAARCQAGRRRLRDDRRDRAAARHRHDEAADRCGHPARRRRGRHQRPRWTAAPEPHGRDRDLAADRAAGRASRASRTTPAATATCSGCSATCSAPRRWGCTTCC